MTFSSSRISPLMLTNGKGPHGFGAGAMTLIEEISIERELGCRLSDDAGSYATQWGNLAEEWLLACDLGIHYRATYKASKTHPEYEFWTGTPDYTVGKEIVGDIKSPQMKAYAGLALCTDLKMHKPEYYWQLVSNACITGAEFAQLYVFYPTEAEVDEILDYNRKKQQHRELWQMPYASAFDYNRPRSMPANSRIPARRIIEFEVSQEDKDFCAERIKLAESLTTTKWGDRVK
jgi:hypothetical protein